MKDNVNHPSHYTDGEIEVIDYIEDKKLGYHLGNAIKYISRAGKKDNSKYVEDLRKAIWYINREIENHKKCSTSSNVSSNANIFTFVSGEGDEHTYEYLNQEQERANR